MTVILPGAVQHLIDSSCALTSVRNLTDALSRGEIDLSVLRTYVKAAEAGTPISFTKTKPIPLLIKECIAAHPSEEPRKLVYLGLSQGRWTYEDVEQWEANAAILSSARKTSVPRGSYLTRKRRSRQRIARVSDQFTPKMAMDVVCSHQICDGAKACLAALMSLAGKSGEVITYTSSIATLMGRTSRTVRNYFMALEEAGLISRMAGKAANTVRIVIKSVCRPEPYAEPAELTAFKLAHNSKDPELRNMARSIVAISVEHHGLQLRPAEGRKFVSAFNSIYKEDTVSSLANHSDMPKSPKRGNTSHSAFEVQMTSNRSGWRQSGLKREGLNGFLQRSTTPTPDAREIPWHFAHRASLGKNEEGPITFATGPGPSVRPKTSVFSTTSTRLTSM